MRTMLVLAVFALAGCQSTTINKSETSWPSRNQLMNMGVKRAQFNVGNTGEIPYLAPIMDRGDDRFIHEAEVELDSVDANNIPRFRAKNNRLFLAQTVEKPVDELGLPNKRWSEIYSFPPDIMAQLKRGHVDVDQVGWSIYVMNSSGHWVLFNRERYRKNQWYAPITAPLQRRR